MVTGPLVVLPIGGRRAQPAGEGAILGLGHLSWRCLADSSLSHLTDSWVRGAVWEMPEKMRHLREGLWSEESKGWAAGYHPLGLLNWPH